jgi:site-specific recombinase XerD
LGLSDYLRWIEEERVFGRGGASLNKNLSHLRGFLDYAWRSGRADRNVLDHFQIQDDGKRKEPESLSIEEAVQLVKSCPTSTPRERRDRMVILLLYGCGSATPDETNG